MNRYKVTMLNGQAPQIPVNMGATSVLVVGSPTLTQSWSLVPTGTAALGQMMLIQYRATPTLGTGVDVTVFDAPIPDNLVQFKLDITATFTASGWQTTMIPSFDQDGFIETAKLKNVGRNLLLIGGADGSVKALDISHLITVENDNTLTLHAGIISATELKSDFTLPLAKVVGAIKGKFIKTNETTGELEAVDMTVELPAALSDLTPGTASVGKAVVLDANGQVSGLDVVGLKMAGVDLDATVGELNLLRNLTSDHIDLLKYLITTGITTTDIDNIKTLRV